MDVKFKIGEIEASVTVKDESEAISFLSQLAGMKQPTAGSSAKSALRDGDAEQEFDDHRHTQVDRNSLMEALSHIRGNPDAKILTILANAPKLAATDKTIRTHLGEMGANLAPYFAHVTKSCKKAGIPLSALLVKKSKRIPGSGGKMKYLYKISKAAAEAVLSIPDFDKVVDIPDFN